MINFGLVEDKMTLFNKYFKNMNGKSVAVIGIGVSNTPLIELLIKAGAKVTAHDKKDKKELGDVCDRFEKLGVSLSVGEKYLKNMHNDYIFRTPGMHPSNLALVEADNNGSIITSEMEVFFETCPCNIIAITGSDGKTTTTTLTGEIMKKAGYTCHLGGNIGKPLLADVPIMKKEDYAIVELSSFQLMTMKKSAKIAAITNVTPNHLDIHKNMEEYIFAKTNIFAHQIEGSKVVLNADDEISKKFKVNRGIEVLKFSMNNPVINGVYLEGDKIIFAQNGNKKEVIKVADIKIPGRHNVANYMTAICLTAGLCSFEDIKFVAQNFGGVAHRIELVRELDGVRYYNDSIASSPTRTIAGLKSFNKKVILIAGGYDKNIPYDVLAPEIITHVKKLILIGATATKIEKEVICLEQYNQKELSIYNFNDFKKAVEYSKKIASEGDIVILSPASASFDIFKNFEERGNYFKELVNNF